MYSPVEAVIVTDWMGRDKRQQGTSATNYPYHYSALGEQQKPRKAKPPETTKSSNKIEKGGSLSMDLSREL